jgi:hypothetical protein
MGQFINIKEINSSVCDKTLFDHFLYIDKRSKFNFFKHNNGIDLVYKNLIKTNKYQEIKSKIIENKWKYCEELEAEQGFERQSDYFIFDYILAENILELMSSYHIMLTHEGMCNLMNYVFYDVYCAKKSYPPYSGYAKPTLDDEYEDAKFYNPNYIASKWNWDTNAVFLGIDESACYEINAGKFWQNFARELLQKIGSVYIHLITHDFKDINIVESYNENFFIIQTSNGPPDEPWYVADMFPRILESHDENSKDSSGKFFTNVLYSSNPLPDFYKSETDRWRPDCGANLYSPRQRKAYGVFQKLIELGISTKNILNGTVTIFENTN